MDTALVLLILGLAFLVIAGLLLWRATKKGGEGEMTLSMADIFAMSVRLGATDTAPAERELREAAEERGGSDIDPSVVPGETAVQLARVLWVDDHPDNNRHETVALEKLGRFITVATSTQAAFHYLERLDFALIITDVGRGSEPDAGARMITNIIDTGITTPIIVYTGDAAAVSDRLLAVGAQAVADMPDDLLRHVLVYTAPNLGRRTSMT